MSDTPELSTRDRAAQMMQQGRYADAAAALRAVVEIDDRDETAWRLLGGALSALGQHTDAIAAFERAVSLSPDSARSHYNLGLALRAAGNASRARDCFRQALAYDPGYAPAADQMRQLDSASGSSYGNLPPTSAVPTPPPPVYGSQSNGGQRYSGPSYGGQTQLPPGSMPSGAPAPNLSGVYRAPVASPVNGTTPLVLSIVGLAGGFMMCGVPWILSPISWALAQGGLSQLNANPIADQSQRGTLQAAKIMGIIGTVLMILAIIFFVIMALAGGFHD